MNVEYREAIAELKRNLADGDLIKARAVLTAFPWSQKEFKRVVFELGRAQASQAASLLSFLLNNADQEGSAYLVLKEALDSHLGNVTDFQALLIGMTVDEQISILPLIMEKMTPGHLCGFCEFVAGAQELHQCLAGLLINSKEALLLPGWLGLKSSSQAISNQASAFFTDVLTPGNLEDLATELGKDAGADTLIHEFFTACLPCLSEQALVGLLETIHGDLRGKVMSCLEDKGEVVVPFLVSNLSEDGDAQVHALNVLGSLGSDLALPAIRQVIFRHSDNINIRFAAYEALGRLPVERQAFALAAGLEDDDDSVRQVVIRAIDRHYNPDLARGLGRMINLRDEGATRIIKLVLNGECERIFMDMVENPFFQRFVTAYLGTSAHPDVRDFFLDILDNQDLTDFADGIRKGKPIHEQAKPLVYAVDDSVMILTIYRNILHQLGCEVVTFTDPMVAVLAIEERRPQIVFTDLNMGKVSGLQFIQTVRLRLSRQVLPMYLVTTQTTRDDHQAALTAGANGSMIKPFTDQNIASVLEGHQCLPTNSPFSS